MSNTLIQIKRSQTTAQPGSLAEGELAYSGNSTSNSLFIGLPDGANTVTRIAGGKYAFLHQANTGNTTQAIVEGGKLTANAVMITDANSSIDEVRTAKLIINTSGNTVNELTSVSTFANSSQLGANAGGSNTEIVTSSAIKTYVDEKTSAIGGALANQQIAYSNGSVFLGSDGFTFNYATNTVSVANALTIGANVTLDTDDLTIGSAVVNSSAILIDTVDANTVEAATSVSVGSNVTIDVAGVTVGNSSVNSSITDTEIRTSGILVVANTATFQNGVDASNTVIANVADPVNPQDAANKRYVDNVAEGLHIHAGVDAATPDTLENISGGTVTYNNGTLGVGATLTMSLAVTTIDDVTLQVGDRVLVKNQANLAHNGIYTYSNSTVLTRATDYDTDLEVAGGDFVFVVNGTLYNSTGWVQIDPVNTIGTDKIEWEQFSGAGTYLAGNYLYLNGNEFNVNASSNSVASVVVTRDAEQNFSANVVSVNSISAGNGQFSGPVSGITTLEAGNTTISGFANVTSSLDVAGPLTVTNTAALGNTTISGFANVNGVLATGNTTVTGFINVSSSADVGGALNVTGAANIANVLAAGNTTVTGFINVSSSATVGGALNVTGAANIANVLAAGNTTITGSANVTVDVNVGGNLTVDGNTALGSDSNDVITFNAKAGSNLIPSANVTYTLGNTTLRWDTLYVDGDNGIYVGPQTISANTTGFDLSGTTLFVNSVSVASLSDFEDLTVNGNTILGSNSSDTTTINARIASDLIPSANLTYDLGTSTLRYKTVYTSNVEATYGNFGDVVVSGNLTVEGTLTAIDTENLVVEDPLIQLARNNTGDSIDIGFYGRYGTPNTYTGLFRDASDSGVYKFFESLTAVPTTTVATGDPSFTIATVEAYLRSGALTTNSSALAITANSTYSVAITANTIVTDNIKYSAAVNQDILVANSSGNFVSLALGADGTVLQSNGTALVYAGLDGGTF